MDPGLKIVTALCAIIIIVSGPRHGDLTPFLLYLLPVFAVAVLSRLPFSYMVRRLLIVSPFILMAAAFYPLSAWLSDSEAFRAGSEAVVRGGLIILFKSLLSLVILIILGFTEKINRLIAAFRRLGMPLAVATVALLVYRYIFLLGDEYVRIRRAYDSRSAGRPRLSRIKTAGNQVAMIFIRSWERSQQVYRSMLSRGFSGVFPDMTVMEIRVADIVYSLLFIALLLPVRLFV